MITVEGYKAFSGIMRISPKNGKEPFRMLGEFLYKPDTDCWYIRGRSFPADICTVTEDFTAQEVFDE